MKEAAKNRVECGGLYKYFVWDTSSESTFKCALHDTTAAIYLASQPMYSTVPAESDSYGYVRRKLRYETVSKLLRLGGITKRQWHNALQQATSEL